MADIVLVEELHSFQDLPDLGRLGALGLRSLGLGVLVLSAYGFRAWCLEVMGIGFKSSARRAPATVGPWTTALSSRLL